MSYVAKIGDFMSGDFMSGDFMSGDFISGDFLTWIRSTYMFFLDQTIDYIDSIPRRYIIGNTLYNMIHYVLRPP